MSINHVSAETNTEKVLAVQQVLQRATFEEALTCASMALQIALLRRNVPALRDALTLILRVRAGAE